MGSERSKNDTGVVRTLSLYFDTEEGALNRVYYFERDTVPTPCIFTTSFPETCLELLNPCGDCMQRSEQHVWPSVAVLTALRDRCK